MTVPMSYFQGEPLKIGNETQLLIDDNIVEDRWALERVLHPPSKHLLNPILVKDKPWEGDIALSPYVMWDEDFGRYRMWYKCFSLTNYWGAGGPPYHLSYAESDDGINWEKPDLDVSDYPGYPISNVVYTGTYRQRTQGVQVIKNPDQSDPNKRYMYIHVEAIPHPEEGLQSGVNVAYSPDGLRWTLPEPPKHILDYHSDCLNHVVYDPQEEQWLLYCRPIHMFSSGRRDLRVGQIGGRHMRRRVSVMTSKDFINWSYPRTCMYPDEMDTPDYDACTVFRWAGQFIMLYAAMEGDVTGSNEVRLASSQDGVNWERFYTREPYIARGREGDWDAGQVTVSGPPVIQGDTMLIYYSGTPNTQYETTTQSGIAVAMAKVDRFVEQRGGDRPGYLLTKEFVVEGNRIKINTVMPGMAYHEQFIRVEIASHPPLGGHHGSSQPYPGFSFEDSDVLKGSRTDMTVTWNGSADISELAGKPVYLRFEIVNMGLFSFKITQE